MRRSTSILCLALALGGAFSVVPRAHATGVEPAKATPLQREQAQQRFKKGKDLIAKKQYDEAVVELRASIEIVESPNTRLELARTLRTMGNLVEAYSELGRTEIEAKELSADDPRYAKAGEAATKERLELAKLLGFVTVKVENATDATTLTIGTEEIRRAGWEEPAPVAPGETEVIVQTPGKPPVKKTVTVSAGGKESLTIDADEGVKPSTPAPTPTPTPEAGSDHSSLRPWAYVSGAVGAAGLATFVVAGLWSNSVYSGLKSDCGSGPCPPSKSDDVHKGKTLQTVANVGLVFGVLGAAGGVTLWLLSSPSSKSTTEVSVGPTGFALRGAF